MAKPKGPQFPITRETIRVFVAKPTRWTCSVDGCKAAIHGADDLPVHAVMQIASPGWTARGTVLTCPYHSRPEGSR